MNSNISKVQIHAIQKEYDVNLQNFYLFIKLYLCFLNGLPYFMCVFSFSSLWYLFLFSLSSSNVLIIAVSSL